MAAVNEQDLQLLESLLDGELDNSEMAALRVRISSEPELAGAIERLGTDRAARVQLWSSLEPSDLEAQRLINVVRSGIRREEVWSIRLRALRNVSGIAAAVVLMFTTGWISRGKLDGTTDVTNVQSSSPTAQLASAGQQQPQVGGPQGSRLVGLPAMLGNLSNGSNTQFVSGGDGATAPFSNVRPGVSGFVQPFGTRVPVDSNGLSTMRPTYKVVLLDPFGKPLQASEYEKIEDARKSYEQYTRFQEQQLKQAPGRSDSVVPVNDRP